MSIDSVRWILDVGMPAGPYRSIDALSAERVPRTPGPVGLREASMLGRTLVTCDQEFRGPCQLNIEHPGVIVLTSATHDALDLERNLNHIEFIAAKLDKPRGLAGCRLVVRPDCEVREILPNGREIEIETWRIVRFPTPQTLRPATQT